MFQFEVGDHVLLLRLIPLVWWDKGRDAYVGLERINFASLRTREAIGRIEGLHRGRDNYYVKACDFPRTGWYSSRDFRSVIYTPAGLVFGPVSALCK